MFNKVILVGNLTRDLELRYSAAGMGIAKTAIATTRKFTANGEKKEEVCFVDVTFFGRSAEVANQYLRKGSKILVEGRLNFEQWTDQNGGKRSKHSVTAESMQMLDGKNDNAAPQAQQSHQGPQNQQQAYNQPQNMQEQPQGGGEYINNGGIRRQGATPEIDIDEDEIPF